MNTRRPQRETQRNIRGNPIGTQGAHTGHTRATNKTMFICHKCSYKAPSIAMLRKHEESDHEESVAYNCNQCNKTFKKKETLNQHKISDHEKEEHQCDI